MPTLRQLYFSSIKRLQSESDEIDVRTLLCHINNIKPLSNFYLSMDEEMIDLDTFNSLFEKYLSGVPMGYLLKTTLFCGVEYYVDNRVLIPRQETEEVVEFIASKIKEIYGEKPVKIADICTGSGCLGIEVSRRVNVSKIYLSDISEHALEVAKINAKNLLKIDYEILQSDALNSFGNLISDIDVIVANPPYIIDEKTVDESVMKNEPHLALFTSDKLDVYRSILTYLKAHVNKVKVIVFELGDEIKDLLSDLIKEIMPEAKVEFKKDINGKTRMVGIII